jgi:cytochrome d ubiquinol oxidase subunit I
MGRQPWIVQGLLKTSDANSPSVSTTWLAISLTVFLALYLLLFVLDVWLMRRFGGRELEAPEAPAPSAAPEPAA